MKKVKLLIAGLTLIFLLAVRGNAFAAQVSFGVNPIIPSNQVTANENYYDLLMTPGVQQTLEVSLSNPGSQPVTVDTLVAPATTNISGNIEYSPNDIKPDPSLKYNLKNYVTVPAKTVVPAKSTVTVPIEVTMPVGATTGIIAGGLTFQQDGSETASSSSNSKGGLTVKNVYTYAVALFMRQSTADVSPVLSLNTVAPGQVNARNVINANLQNSAMNFVKQMNVDAVVTGITNKSLTYKFQNTDIAMAPNSNFDLPIPVSTNNGSTQQGYSQPLQAGTYHLAMTVYAQKDTAGQYATTVAGKTVNYDYKWTFSKDFTIAAKTAQKLNATDVTINHHPPFDWLLVFGIALIVLAVLFILFIIWRRKKDNNDMKEKMKLQIKLDAANKKLKAIDKEKEQD